MSYEASKGGRLLEAAYLPRGVGFLIAIESLNRLVIVSLIARRSSSISDLCEAFGGNKNSSSETGDRSSSSLSEVSSSSMSKGSTLLGTSPEAINVAGHCQLGLFQPAEALTLFD